VITLAEATLPIPLRSHEAVYDGADSIYILGGLANGSLHGSVYKYSLATDTISVHGIFVRVAYGAAAIDMTTQSILYFGGQTTSGRTASIRKYSIVQKTNSVVNTLPSAMEGMALAWNEDERVALLFGGYAAKGNFSDQILKYSANDNAISQVGQLPEKRFEAAAVWDDDEGAAYLFGGHGASETMKSDIVRYDPTTGAGTASRLSTDLPHRTTYPCAMYANGKLSYTFGGGELIKYNGEDGTAMALDVDGWPSSLSMAACVYVQNLNRIYIIGGYGQWNANETEDTYKSEIAYIDLGGPSYK
jgi:hypothetical protein